MRRLLLAAALVVFSAPVQAKGYHYKYRHHLTHHYGHYLAQRHLRHHYSHRVRYVRRYFRVSGGSLPGPCRVAASMGGPCGCWAAYVLLGKLDHVWRGYNLWLANDWLRFPHVTFAAATAVVWPGRHVAPVVPGSYSNGTIMVRDSWATHRVRTAGLVPVQPPGTGVRTQPARVTEAWPL